MKKSLMIILMVALTAMLFVTGCSKDDEDSDFETLINYMDGNGKTLAALTTSWIIGADSTFQANIANYYILDLRGGDTDENEVVDYVDGHIPGAVLVNFGNLLEMADDVDKPIIVVCYTGQSAGHAVMALRLSGYMDAKVLKWGMSGWNSEFDSWSGNTGNVAIGNSNWVVAPGDIMPNDTFDMPNLVATASSGEAILAERVATMLTGGFKGIAGVDVLDAPEDYFINNYWAEADVIQYGNIDTAYRLQPLVLENLNPDEIIVTYCWTGQTSSMITAYLTVLGYNAKSLKFGANSMIYDDLESHKWSGSANWEYE